MRRTHTIAVAIALLAGARTASSQPAKDYYAFVASEGNDYISLVKFGPSGASVERKFRMGTNPTELVGPHGVAVSPDGRHYYVSTAHGMPNGALWKFSTVGDSLLGRVTLGAFPATVQVSPNGAYIFVVNFNLHGDMVPSSVSVVYGDGMVEIARITTCVMPHGSRLNKQGTKHYSACMMNDALVEIDATTFKVARHFMLTKGAEHGMAGPVGAMAGEHAMADASGHGMAATKPGDVSCSPTWAQPSADGAKVYVACNKSNDIVEIDVASWKMTRRIPTGDGVYNLATTNDGRLLVGTNKRGQSVSVIEVASGKELARIPTTRKVASGVALSSDNKYAFVTVEGIGSQPGTVDIIDLGSLTKVASVDVGQQAGGIDFWKTIPLMSVPNTMRAGVIARPGGPEVLEIQERPVPQPAADQVLVRVRASGLNRADLLQRQGLYPAPPGAPIDIPGLEFAGEIAALGGGVSDWAEGDRVFGIVAGGANAEFLVADAKSVARVPSKLSWTDAAAIPEAFMTAYDAMVTQAGVRANENVLIHAVGSGVGLAAVQLARGWNATPYGTARTASKVDRAREFGLVDGIAIGDTVDALVPAIEQWTGGKGIGVTLDLVGGPYLAASIAGAAFKGRIMLIGAVAGRSSTVPIGMILSKRLTLIGTTLRARSVEEKRAVTAAFARDVVPLLESGAVVPVVDAVVPLDRIREAHERLASNETFGKVVLQH